MTEMNEQRGMGWLPDYPDFRDHTVELDELPPRLKALGQRDSVKVMLKKVGAVAPPKALPASIDLRAWCAPIEDQGALGSCTANAGVGVVEYFERRAFGLHLDASRLFLYKATRNLMHWTGDTGAFLRSTMGALVLFGVPPEEYWPVCYCRLRQGAERLLLCLCPELSGHSILPARSDRHQQTDPAHPDQDQSGGGAAVNVRVYGLHLDLPGGRERQDPLPYPWGKGGRRACHRGRGV